MIAIVVPWCSSIKKAAKTGVSPEKVAMEVAGQITAETAREAVR
jgi:hypothetical protein